ncbi:hypothetical protein BD779DRAFT_1487548, partial [Infundibulicybe gibba]
MKAFDDVLHHAFLGYPSHPRAKTIRLPAEILLIIRAYLFPIITQSLIVQSASALTQYETSLRDLLCQDCILYNEEIYGPDVWTWEQFSGACACMEMGVQPSPRISSTPKPNDTNPQQFNNAQHWLEHHLSCQARLMSGCDTSDIWATIANALYAYGCEVVNNNSSKSIAQRQRNSSLPQSEYQWDGDILMVAATRSAIGQCEHEGIGEAGPVGDRWRAQVILNRADRDLGLSSHYQYVFGDAKPRFHPPIALTCPETKSTMESLPHHHFPFHIAAFLFQSLNAVLAIFAASISLPFTITTLSSLS